MMLYYSHYNILSLYSWLVYELGTHIFFLCDVKNKKYVQICKI